MAIGVRRGVRFTVGVFVPDTDDGGFVRVELQRDTVGLDVMPVACE